MAEASKHVRGTRWRLSDLRAAIALAQRAGEGVLDITEGVHQSVRKTLGFSPGIDEDRCGGLSGRVYSLVRGGHALIGDGTQAALRGLEGLRADSSDVAAVDEIADPQRLGWLAVLNGVCGDHLHATGNALAIQPGLHARGRSLQQAFAAAADSGHLLVLVHGLCMNDLQWRGRGDPGHGEAMGEALGAVSVYFRYNSGLSIDHNGRQLSDALEAAFASMSRAPARISLIGHSMGGLVARSAERHARSGAGRWRPALRDLVLLGTPNDGAPLERLGHSFERVLGSMPFARQFTRIGALRSQGILDLREGRLSPDSPPDDLPTDVRCFAVAAVLARAPEHASAHLLGDGLVPIESALGRRTFGTPVDDELVVPGTGHLQLLRSAVVRRQLSAWLGAR